jgi:hypothetical protein
VSEGQGEPVPIPLVWVGLDEEPVVLANQFIGQIQQDEIIISMGVMVQPPVIGDTEQERREQVMRITHVPVQPVVRLTLTPRRIEELMTMLRDTLALYGGRYGSQAPE